MPTPSKSVQFQSIDTVMAAYVNREVPAFAIWCGKQFLFKYEGKDLSEGENTLREILQMLQSNESAAIYTLCVYEDLKEKEKIKDNTPYDGSFNFRFAQHAVGYLPGMQGGVGALQSELVAMRMELKKLQEEKDNNEPDSQLGIVGEILEHPAIEPLVPIVAGRIVDLLFPEEPAKTSRIAGVNLQEVTDDEKIREALKKLSEKVADLPELLFKMAMLSEKKPGSFNFYMTTLRAMKL